jgi:hypothetical protein
LLEGGLHFADYRLQPDIIRNVNDPVEGPVLRSIGCFGTYARIENPAKLIDTHFTCPQPP